MFLGIFFRAQLAKTYQTAAVLFEVLKAVTQTESAEVDPEVRDSTTCLYIDQKAYAYIIHVMGN